MTLKERVEELKKYVREFRAAMRDKEKRSDMQTAFLSGLSRGIVGVIPYYSLAGIVYFLTSNRIIHHYWYASLWVLLFLSNLYSKHLLETRDRMIFQETTAKEVAVAAAAFLGKQLQHAVQNGYRPPVDTQFPGKRGKMDS